MKRTPLTRKTPMARGTATLARAPLAPGTPKRRQRIPPSTRKAVFARSRRKCIVCQRRVRLQIHHCLPVRLFPALELDPDGMVGICGTCHERHENASRRIRWNELPACAVTLAYATSGAAAVFLERTYPRG
jgi:5-methylcytosine-specific restriction endonuclease McrA